MKPYEIQNNVIDIKAYQKHKEDIYNQPTADVFYGDEEMPEVMVIFMPEEDLEGEIDFKFFEDDDWWNNDE